jgi:hypothetical protein
MKQSCWLLKKVVPTINNALKNINAVLSKSVIRAIYIQCADALSHADIWTGSSKKFQCVPFNIGALR